MVKRNLTSMQQILQWTGRGVSGTNGLHGCFSNHFVRFSCFGRRLDVCVSYLGAGDPGPRNIVLIRVKRGEIAPLLPAQNQQKADAAQTVLI